MITGIHVVHRHKGRQTVRDIKKKVIIFSPLYKPYKLYYKYQLTHEETVIGEVTYQM